MIPMAKDVIKVDAKEALAWIRRLAGPQLRQYQQALLDAMAKEAMHIMGPLIPIDTGRLRSSMAIGTRRNSRWIGTTAEHGIFAARDTRPHIIMPKKWGGVLSWKSKGRYSGGRYQSGERSFAAYVMHPGTTGRPYDQLTVGELEHKLPAIQRDIAARTLGAY